VAKAPGSFIVLEGPDGGGKTSVMEALVRHLDEREVTSVIVREPGGTLAGERVREILLEPGDELSPTAELFLYMAARTELAERVIRPALQDGSVVVSERWLYSSIVYQGLAGGLGEEVVRDMGRLAVGDLEPDLVCVLLVDAETGLARIGGALDRMEAKGVAYHRRVVEGYRELAGRGGIFRAVDAARPLDEVVVEVIEEVDRVLG
jgi:dTMP kinase